MEFMKIIKDLFTPSIKDKSLQKVDAKILSNLPEQSTKKMTVPKLAVEYKRAIQCYEDKVCPSCSHRFEKTVTRKRSCPTCKISIVVRTHYEVKQKMLLMEVQMEEYEKESRNNLTSPLTISPGDY